MVSSGGINGCNGCNGGTTCGDGLPGVKMERTGVAWGGGWLLWQ